MVSTSTSSPRCECPSARQSNKAIINSAQRRPGLTGEGYGDGELLIDCPTCAVKITKEFLGVAKFVNHAKALLLADIPMPGTILDPKMGWPKVLANPVPGMSDDMTFPNRMIRHALRSEVVELIKPGVNPAPNMETVRRLIESVLGNQARLRGVDGMNTPFSMHHYRLRPAARLSVRKMMSRYWDNFSPFALDLSGAVMRQGIFVEKMCKIDWLHSPSARETMVRLLNKYSRFFNIMATHPDNVAVPTLDIDLAWHTHQLSPFAYMRYATKMTNKFIDHDDKIDESRLGQAFEWTSEIYQERYNEVYSECTCWYCEGRFNCSGTPVRVFS